MPNANSAIESFTVEKSSTTEESTSSGEENVTLKDASDS